jgi:hypothetical protein
MWRQTQVEPRELEEYTVVSSSPNKSLHDTNYNELFGRSSSLSFTPFSSGMMNGEERRSALPVIIPVLLMQSTSARFKDQRFFSSNDCSLLQQSTISKSSHSEFHLRRIWLLMRLLVMTTKDLLILVYRSQSSLSRQPCTESCVPSSQLPRGKYSAQLQENPPKIHILLPAIRILSLPCVFPNSRSLDR